MRAALYTVFAWLLSVSFWQRDPVHGFDNLLSGTALFHPHERARHGRRQFLQLPVERGARGSLHGPATLESVQEQIRSIESIHTVRVEHSRVLGFERIMEALYDSRRDTEVENRLYGMNFVHHPRPYTYYWNSNHAAASWLRELGCQTQGLSFRASWQVAAPDQAGE